MFINRIEIYLLVVIQVISLNVHGVPPDDDFWTCDDGEKIMYDYRCNGRNDCKDLSDETEKNCRQIECPSFYFQCQYGACISKKLRCNGVNDCVDGSDEKSSDCEAKINEDLLSNFEYDPCRATGQSKCLSSGCIDLVDVCDGKADCEDGSDEREGVCKQYSCPSYAFQCKYGACVSGNAKCNGIKDCADNSDEDRELCSLKVEGLDDLEGFGEFNTHSFHKSCRIPTTLYSLTVENYITKVIYPLGSEVDGDRTSVRFYCENGKILEGCATSTCIDGKWISPLPRCKEYRDCDKLDIDSVSRRAVCIHNGKQIDCKGSLKSGTKVEFTCAFGYKSVDDFKSLTCDEYGSWNDSTLMCRPICGLIKPVFSKTDYPWLVSIFKRDINKNYVFLCTGYIISERLIITTPSCLGYKSDIHSNNHQEYQILLGYYNETYSQADYLGYSFYNVEDIKLQRWQMKSQSDQLLSVILIDKYIKFSNLVAPICLASEYLFEKMESDEDERPFFFDKVSFDVRSSFKKVGHLLAYENRKIYTGLQKIIDSNKV